MRLHPLHHPGFVMDYTRNTGEYFPQERYTGRTTCLALQYIAQAIQQPHTAVKIKDHHGTVSADRELMRRMQDMVRLLGLEHMQFKMDNTVIFTNI